MAGIDDYMRLLRGSPIEVQALFQERLIPATSFFRDPDAYEFLKRDGLPKFLAERPQNATLRVWVVGCSTGEEVYSLAMMFAELAEATGRAVPLRIFATDLNAAAITSAQTGSYPSGIAQDLSPDRLRRFFSASADGFQVSDPLRAVCEFSRHNALSDPPLADMDFISCRNLLIYLDEAMQRQLVATLHAALRPVGRLWLGRAERLNAEDRRFTIENARYKLYAKNPA